MKLFRKRESNWETYSALDPMKKYQYRDVFKHQRLERADVEEAETMTSRLIALAVMTVGVFMLVWLVLSAAQMFGGGFANQLNRTSGQSSAQYADTGQAGQTGSGQDTGTVQDGGQSGQAQVMPGFDESGEVVAGEPTLREFQVLQNSYFDPFREQYFVKTRSNSSLHQYFSKASGEEWNFNDIYRLWTEITRGNYAAYCALRNGSSGTDWADGSEGNYVLPAEWQAELAAEGAGTESGGGDSSGAGSQSGGEQGSGSGFSLGSAKFGGVTLGECLRSVRPWKVFWSLFSTAIFALVMYFILKRNWEVQTAGKRTDNMNQWENDQHIQLVEEVQQNYDYFPDVGAHCPVQVASTISHVMLSNKGVKTVQLVRRTEKDIVDKDGETTYYKGEVLLDDDGEPIVDELPMFDKKFGLALFDSAKALDDKRVRVFYSPKDILYNDGDKNRDKLKGARTVADMINKYWHIPDYEPQRPAGAYLVDTAPVNTMVLAITRAGKGKCLAL